MQSYVIDWIGGNCPVQAEGMIGGKTRFYFRARGDKWSMEITNKSNDSLWYYSEPFGVWPEAGWITESEARAYIDKAFKLWQKENKRGKR